MARRQSIFEDLVEMPWQVGIALAVITFALFQGAQLFIPEDMAGQALRPLTKVLGWGLPAAMLFAALLSFLAQIIRGNRFKNTRSMSEICNLTWRQFESFVGEYFRQQGYFVVETPEGPDNGVDLVLRKDGEKTYVQCKQWKTNQVTVEKVRGLLGSMAAGGAQGGIFVTTGKYTEAARKSARECGIRLIDGSELTRLIKPDEMEHVNQKPAPAPIAPPDCPDCGAGMVKRVAKRGANKGNSFWGCSGYPKCRGIRSIQSVLRE